VVDLGISFARSKKCPIMPPIREVVTANGVATDEWD